MIGQSIYASIMGNARSKVMQDLVWPGKQTGFQNGIVGANLRSQQIPTQVMRVGSATDPAWVSQFRSLISSGFSGSGGTIAEQFVKEVRRGIR